MAIIKPPYPIELKVSQEILLIKGSVILDAEADQWCPIPQKILLDIFEPLGGLKIPYCIKMVIDNGCEHPDKYIDGFRLLKKLIIVERDRYRDVKRKLFIFVEN